MAVCSFCQAIGLLLEKKGAGRYQYHHASIVDLIASSKTCPMCHFLLTLYPNSKKVEIFDLARGGSYTKAVVVTLECGDPQLEKNPAFKYLEISTRSKSFASKQFAVSSADTQYGNRAIWSSSSPFTFNERISVIHEWLAECISNHCKCSEITPCLPTRVIDVASADGLMPPRLVHSQDLERRPAPYTALSHCWGPFKLPVTTKENLQLHLRSLDFNCLPKTYKDAITITRKLKIQYLWIDSLCIIQDDTADWEREAASMAMVYSHAHLTIAAASATDSRGGCYIDEAIQPTNLQIKIDHPKGTLTNAYIRYPAYRPDSFYDSPLHQRGWVLQEAVLSRRILYFTKDQMFWQCNSRQYAEDGLEVGNGGFKVHVDNMVHEQRKYGRFEYPSWSDWGSFISREPGNLAIYDLSTPEAGFHTWWRWVVDYRSRQLTEITDRFAALAGIVKHYQSRIDDKPLAGLWERDIKSHLLWTYKKPHWNPVFTSWRAPSWSWVTIDGTPVYPPQLPPKEEQDANSATKAGVQFLGSEILWSGEPLTSNLMKATLHLRGRIREMTLHSDKCTLHNGKKIPCMLKSHHSTTAGEHTSDRADLLNGHCPLDLRSEADFDRDEPNRKTVLCLLVTRSETEEKMLMIALTGNAANEYRRVGVATHFHVVERYNHCDKPGCEAKVCLLKSSYKTPPRRFTYDDCFRGVEETVISLV